MLGSAVENNSYLETFVFPPTGGTPIYSLYGYVRAAGQGMVFGLAVLNRVYISPKIVLNRVYNLDKRPR